MATHVSHASVPFPIKNARYTLLVPMLDSTGTPTDPTTPDTEVSQDGGAFADAAEEVTTISGSNGMGLITLSGAETNNSAVGVAFKVASGPKATLATLYPRNLPILASGTASAGAAGTLTLASSITYDIAGCFLRTTGGTGGGGTGGANNQARRIVGYNTSTQVATISPNWETTPDNTTTYDVLLPEGVTPSMIKQTGDSFARLGAPAGASVSADIAAISIVTGAGDFTTKTADSATLTTGSTIGGAYTDTASDNDVYWITAPVTPAVGGFGLRQQLVFNLALNRVPVNIQVRGWWNGTGTVDVYALNSRTSVYDKLTNTGTNLASRANELLYQIPLPRDYADNSGGSFNVVTIEFRAASTTTANRLRIDQALIAHVSETALPPSPEQIWTYPSRELTTPGVEPQSFPANFETMAISVAGGVTLADGVAHGGTPGSSTATLALSRLVATSQTASEPAVKLTGNLDAVGLLVQGGEYGGGALIRGNSNGTGLAVEGGDFGHGATMTGGSSSGYGLHIESEVATGLVIEGMIGIDVDGSDGPALDLSAGDDYDVVSLTANGNGNAVNLQGSGTGAGWLSTGGDTGPGAKFVGGSTSGIGVVIDSPSDEGLYIAADTRGINVSGGTEGINVSAGTKGISITSGEEGILITSTGTSISAGNGLDAPFLANTLASLFLTDSGETYSSAVAGSVVKEIADNAGGGGSSDVNVVTIEGTDATNVLDARIDARLTAFGVSVLTAAGVRTAVGLASANLDTQLGAIAGYIDTEVAAALAAVDTEVAAIKTKTDQLTFTVSNRVDSTTQTGLSTLDAAGVRTAVGLGSANLDTQLTDLPTNAELATALAAADDAVLAAIAALNNLSAAAINAEVLDVLTTDTFAEPTAPPAATASLKDKIGWLAVLARNKITQTSTTQTIFRDDGTTTMAVSTHGDNGTVYTRGEVS